MMRAPATEAPLEALIGAAVRKSLAYSPVWLPARVVAFKAPSSVPDPGGVPRQLPARVDVQIDVLAVEEISTAGDLRPGWTLRRIDGRLEAEGPYPLVPDVAVCWGAPRGLRVRGPLAVGETGALLVSTRALESWRDGSGVGQTPDREIGALALTSSLFIPGLELGLSEAHADWSGLSIGLPGPGVWTLGLSPVGAWDLRGLTVDVRSPSTSIGAVGPGVSLAKNAQQLALWGAFNAAVQALPPGTLDDLKAVLAALLPTLPAISIGTLTLTAE
jgi:hypothetical protein